MSAELSYRISVTEPERHLAQVEATVTGAAELGEAVELSMAAWCPGSYLVRDYARFVRELRATDGAGNPLSVRKIRKHTWRVDRGDAAEVVVSYQVYGFDLSVRTNHIDESHAFLHGPAVYLWSEALRDRPCTVTIDAPAGWDVATGLDRDGQVHRAADLDQLLDCPIHLGEVEARSFEAAGKPVRFVVWGAEPRGRHADFDRLVTDLTAIIEAHAERFDGPPYQEYTFILMLAPRAYGGLEHCNSSANLHNPEVFESQKEYEGLLELLSHEFFHVWNGKRLYPEAFAPFDYSRENYTSKLWVMEGLTSYFDRYTLRLAGRMSAKKYLEKLCEEWGRLQTTPGRSLQSLEESSFDAWIKLYKPDASNVNTTVSYYLKGGLVAMAMDLAIRRRSGGERRLRDVLAQLWERYGAAGAPYPEGDIRPDFEAATGLELEAIFDACVHGRGDPELPAELGHLGLELRGVHGDASEAARSSEDQRIPAWIGVSCKGKGTTVATVLDGGPAAAAGISPADELIALDGFKVSGESDLRKRVGSREPGAAIELALFRKGRLRTARVTTVPAPPTRYEIAGSKEPTSEQQRRYRDWLGEDHPGPGVIAGAAVARIL